MGTCAKRIVQFQDASGTLGLLPIESQIILQLFISIGNQTNPRATIG